MRIAKIVLQSAALLALAASTMHAQTINQRKENQQDRIANGVKSGELTPRETANLETKESALNKEEHNMRAADNGHLTAADRTKIDHQQNRLSQQIYNKKHDARVQ
jgi:hypothetical protein